MKTAVSDRFGGISAEKWHLKLGKKVHFGQVHAAKAFYLQPHTAEYPDGAMPGQLSPYGPYGRPAPGAALT